MQNLIPLILFRPLRIFISASKLRSGRIALLKVTHLPYIAAIWAYESAAWYLSSRGDSCQNTSAAQRYSLIGSPVETMHTPCQDQMKGSKADAASPGKKTLLEAGSTEASAAEIMGELQRSIAQLRVQLDELSRRIATSQGD